LWQGRQDNVSFNATKTGAQTPSIPVQNLPSLSRNIALQD
jgi:hypothetical protein